MDLLFLIIYGPIIIWLISAIFLWRKKIKPWWKSLLIKFGIPLLGTALCFTIFFGFYHWLATHPYLDTQKVGDITAVTTFQTNFSEVFQVDPNGQKVNVKWNLYKRPPYAGFSEITLASESETYFITNKTRGDGVRLIINDQSYDFNVNEKYALITFGSGVSIEKGFESSLETSWRSLYRDTIISFFDLDFSKLKAGE